MRHWADSWIPSSGIGTTAISAETLSLAGVSGKFNNIVMQNGNQD
jgi:hypothetical protein